MMHVCGLSLAGGRNPNHRKGHGGDHVRPCWLSRRKTTTLISYISSLGYVSRRKASGGGAWERSGILSKRSNPNEGTAIMLGAMGVEAAMERRASSKG